MRGTAVALLILALGVASGAEAQSQVERGRYLVESIVGCGNCPTPQGPSGPVAGKFLPAVTECFWKSRTLPSRKQV